VTPMNVRDTAEIERAITAFAGIPNSGLIVTATALAIVLRENPKLLGAGILYLINDSAIGPLNEAKFASVLRKVRSSASDVVGLTESYEGGWHLQSYFIALKSAALSSRAWQAFIASIKSLSEKRAVINAYETRLATTLRAAGLRCEALFPARSAHNPSLANWRDLIGRGLPFVKVAALRKEAFGSNENDWRQVLRDEGFDHRIAEATLAEVSHSR
jgi:hypothetical protein